MVDICSLSAWAICCKQNAVTELWNKALTQYQRPCVQTWLSETLLVPAGDELLVKHLAHEPNWYQQEVMLLEAAILNSAGNAMFLLKCYLFSGTQLGNIYAILDTTTLVFIYKHSIFFYCKGEKLSFWVCSLKYSAVLLVDNTMLVLAMLS